MLLHYGHVIAYEVWGGTKLRGKDRQKKKEKKSIRGTVDGCGYEKFWSYHQTFGGCLWSG